MAWSSGSLSVAATSSRILILGLLLLAGCTSVADPTTTSGLSTVKPEPSTTSSTSSTSTSLPPTATSTPAPGFEAAIDPVTEDQLAHSWREGCPVGVEDLRVLTVTHWDFEDRIVIGRIVVHTDQAEPVVSVFEALFDQGFPMVSLIPIGDLRVGAEDDPDYANTSGFHCRVVAGTNRWSQHAYGLAIDLNPFQNPWVSGSEIWPIGAGRYLDRDLGDPGMITDGDGVIDAFESIGWSWGGNWSSLKDYHHFSSTGR